MREDPREVDQLVKQVEDAALFRAEPRAEYAAPRAILVHDPFAHDQRLDDQHAVIGQQLRHLVANGRQRAVLDFHQFAAANDVDAVAALPAPRTPPGRRRRSPSAGDGGWFPREFWLESVVGRAFQPADPVRQTGVSPHDAPGRQECLPHDAPGRQECLPHDAPGRQECLPQTPARCCSVASRIARSMSRFMSAFFRVSRLSCSFLPRHSPSRTLTTSAVVEIQLEGHQRQAFFVCLVGELVPLAGVQQQLSRPFGGVVPDAWPAGTRRCRSRSARPRRPGPGRRHSSMETLPSRRLLTSLPSRAMPHSRVSSTSNLCRALRFSVIDRSGVAAAFPLFFLGVFGHFGRSRESSGG